jgi:dihydroorotase
VIDLPTTMSKFLHLGLTPNQAIEKVTANPARILKFPEKIGSLEPGNVADVSVIEIQNGDFDLMDSTREKRTVHQRIVPVAAVRAGKLSIA